MNTDETTCPDCAETIKVAAKVCKHCGFRAPLVVDQASVEEPFNHSIDDALPAATWEQPAVGNLRVSENAFAGKALAFVAILGLLYWLGSLALDNVIPKPKRQVVATTPTIDAEARDYDKEIADLDDEQKGFHCLSRMDGSQPELVAAVKRGLRDPDSYQHIETRITPIDASGKHNMMMHYRARNGFGGMTDGVVTATVDPSTCKVHVLESE